MQNIKLKRGQKLCPECNSVNAARSYQCKMCGSDFLPKNTLLKNEVENWRDLQKGEEVKVIQGSGPFFRLDKDCEDGSRNERLYMNESGVYTIVELRDNGVMAYGDSGYAFLYMGPSVYREETGINREPYRLKRVKRRVRKR
jgi:hypothetical protein